MPGLTAELVTTTSQAVAFAAAWPLEDAGPEADETIGNRALAEIGARDGIAHREQDLRDAAHTDTTDANEVDALSRGKEKVAGQKHRVSLDALLHRLPDELVDLEGEAGGEAVGKHPVDELARVEGDVVGGAER